MNTAYYLTCVNCGKQTLTYGRGDKCQFCGKSPFQKEGAMVAENKPDTVAPGSTVPPRPEGRRECRLYWEKHKEEVLADLKRIGYSQTVKRWKISPGVLTKLRGNKGLKSRGKVIIPDKPSPEQPKEANGEPIFLGTHKVVATNTLPGFPSFNDNWPMLTQIEWLQTYRELVRLL